MTSASPKKLRTTGSSKLAKLEETVVQAKNGQRLIITSPVPGEGAELLAFAREIFSTSEHVLTTPEEFGNTSEQQDEMIRDYGAHPEKILIVAKIGKQIIGVVDFKTGGRNRTRHQGEFGMSVRPKFQGLGIGEIMLKALIKWATAHPRIETLRLQVFARNTRAIALYNKLDFVEEGRQVRGVKFAKGKYDDVLVMARSVEQQT